MVIRAVVFDLDDTLFDQQQWLTGAWQAVAAATSDIDERALHKALIAVAVEGTDRGGIIDRALQRVGAGNVEVAPLVQAFRRHAPPTLPLHPGALDGIRALRRVVRVGVVTDGDPRVQRAKLTALRLVGETDAVVFSDEMGRERRKPHPAPMLAAAQALGVEPATCVYVGDRPAKDVAGAKAAGYLGCVRVRTGEYRGAPDEPCLATLPTVADAIRWLLVRVEGA